MGDAIGALVAAICTRTPLLGKRFELFVVEARKLLATRYGVAINGA